VGPDAHGAELSAAVAPDPFPKDYFPVSGEVDANGCLLDLVGIVNSMQGASITPPPPPDWTGAGQPQLIEIAGNAELTARLGFGSFDVTAEGSTQYLVVDLLQTQELASDYPDGPVEAWVFGVGLRQLLRAANISGELNADYGSFAAAGTLGLAETSFEFQTIGLGLGALPLMRGLILQALKGWDAGTTIAFGDAWFQLAQHIVNGDPSTFAPRLVGIRLGAFGGIDSLGGSYGFALRAIRKPLTGNAALDAPSSFPQNVGLDVQIVEDVCGEVVGSMDNAPSSADQQTAADLDDSGP
jgi:hypothetical protein